MKTFNNFQYKLIVTVIFLIGMVAEFNAQSSPQIAKGDSYFSNQEYTDAIDLYLLAYQMDESIESTRKLAETYQRIGQNEKCEQWLQTTIQFEERTAEDVLWYAEILKILQKYPEAIEQYKEYIKLKPNDQRAQEHVRNEKYYLDLWKDSLKYEMHILGINGDMEAFGVVPYGGNKYMFSASQVNNKYCTKRDNKKDLYLDVYECVLDENEQFSEGKRLDKPINSKYHDGPIFYDTNSKTMFITRNNMKGDEPVVNKNGDVILKIYTYQNIDGEWKNEAELPLNSEEYSTGHPCLSADGKTLYFSSNIPGGYGKADIYQSKWVDDHWGKPENLGPNINTEGNEMFPYVSKEGIIYFSSDGHAGLGGLDNFMCEPWGNEWSVAYNLGSPINTNFDDFSLLFVPGKEIGFFTSNRSGKGFGDMYFFKQIEIFEQQLVGRIVLESNLYSLEGKKIKVKYLNSDKTTFIKIGPDGYFNYKVYVDEQIEFSMVDTSLFLNQSFVGYNAPHTFHDPSIDLGSFVITTKEDKKRRNISPSLALEFDFAQEVINDLMNNQDNINQKNLSKIEDYLNSLEKMTEDNLRNKLLDLKAQLEYLKNLVSASEYVVHDDTEMFVLKNEVSNLNINNVYFGFDSYAITANASTTLDKIIYHMNNNPEWKIEIDTHTDSRGSIEYNKYLSQQRANAVRRYLKYQGISEDRILLRWHGEDELISPEKTEEDYRLNRRAEFRYLVKSDRI